MKKKIIIISILVVILGYFVVTTKIGADISNQELAVCEKVVIPNTLLEEYDVTSSQFKEYLNDFDKDSYYKIDSSDELTIYIKPEQKESFKSEIRSLVNESINDFESKNEKNKCVCNEDFTYVEIYMKISVTTYEFNYLTSWIDFGAELLNLIDGNVSKEPNVQFCIYNADTDKQLVSFGHNEEVSIEAEDWLVSYPDDVIFLIGDRLLWDNLKIDSLQFMNILNKYEYQFITLTYRPDTEAIIFVIPKSNNLGETIIENTRDNLDEINLDDNGYAIDINSEYSVINVSINAEIETTEIAERLTESIIDCELYQVFVSQTNETYSIEIYYYDSSTGNLLGKINFPEDEFKIITSE